LPAGFYFLGLPDEETGRDVYSVRSVDKLVTQGDDWFLRDIPDDGRNAIIPYASSTPS
jgi:hypothetical protein